MTASKGKALRRSGLDTYIHIVNPEERRQGALHVRNVRIELWTLCTYRGVNITDLPPFATQQVDCLPEKDLAIYTFKL